MALGPAEVPAGPSDGGGPGGLDGLWRALSLSIRVPPDALPAWQAVSVEATARSPGR